MGRRILPFFGTLLLIGLLTVVAWKQLAGRRGAVRSIPVPLAAGASSPPPPPWVSEPTGDPPAVEKLLQNAAVQTYEVPGQTWQELSANVETFGTQAHGAPAKTSYSLAWHPGQADGKGGLSNGIASAEVVVTFPHWTAMPRSADDARQWWSYFIRRLAQSQQAHVNAALSQAELATSQMRQATPDSAQSIWKEINDRLSNEQRAYDAAHGQTETDFHFEPNLAVPIVKEYARGVSGAVSPPVGAVDAGPRFPSPLPAGSAPFALDLPLRTLDGSFLSLESKRGQVMVVNFWATWCGFCRLEEPSFEALMQQVRDQNIVFAFVTTESQLTVKTFLDRSHWDVPVYLTSSMAANAYESSGIPETFILSKSGDVAMKVPGARDWSQPQMVAYLRSLASQ